MRTGRGPQASWLHKIGKVTSPACTLCNHNLQDGEHLTFHCKAWNTQREKLIGRRESFGELDDPIWIKADEDESFDGVEEWFSYIDAFLT